MKASTPNINLKGQYRHQCSKTQSNGTDNAVEKSWTSVIKFLLTLALSHEMFRNYNFKYMMFVKFGTER